MEVLSDEMETVRGFCYLKDRLNASGGCETAVTSRVFYFYLLLAYLSSYHEKATKRCTSSLRSCRPSVYHTKMGESC